jgi:hypothetical protein
MDEEGWYVDPYDIHEARWVSAGVPTALVRDDDVETQDPPPSIGSTGQLQELEEAVPHDGGDLLRADSADGESFDPEAAEDAGWGSFGPSSGGD